MHGISYLPLMLFQIYIKNSLKNMCAKYQQNFIENYFGYAHSKKFK